MHLKINSCARKLCGRTETLLVVSAVFSLLLFTPARAAERDWGNSGTDFNDGTNWGGVAPGLGDVGWFKTAATIQPNVSAPLSISGLYFSSSGSSGYHITNTNSAALTLTGYAANVSGGETSDATAAAIGANNTSGTNTIDVPLILGPASGSTSTFFKAAGGTVRVNGGISGTGISLTNAGSGTLVLAGQNTYSGGTSLSTGSLLLGSSGVVSAGGSITSGPVGTGTLTMTGGTLSSDSTTPRTIQNNVGLSGSITLGDATKNGTLTFNSTDGSNTLTTPATITLVSNPTWTVNSPVVIADVIGSPSVQSFTIAGSSTLTLSTAATYLGATTISSGATLQLGAANAIPQSSAAYSSTVNGRLDLNTFNQTFNNLHGGGTIDTVAGGTPILTVAGTSSSFDGVIQNTAGTLSLNVTGLLTLTGLAGKSTYTGTTTIGAGGNLTFGSSSLGAWALSPGGAIIDNGTLTLTSYLFNEEAQGINFSGSPITGTGQVTVDGLGGPTYYGVVLLKGANTYSGGTTLGSATLQLGSSSTGSVTSGPVGTGTLTLEGGGTLSSDSTTPRTLANAVTFGGGGAILGDATNNGMLTLSGPGTISVNGGGLTVNSDVTYSGNIGETGGTQRLGKGGPGTLILSGSNTYSGGTFIAGGTLSVASIGNSGASSPLGTGGTITFSSSTNPGGTLKYTGTGETSNKVISFITNGTAGGGTIDQSGTGLLEFTNNVTGSYAGTFANHPLTLQGSTSGTGELSGVISNAGAQDIISVTKNGTGTWTLSGANTYTGATTVNGGSLLVNGSLASGSAVSVSNAGTILGGTGTINGAVTVNAGATLQGGNGMVGTALTLSNSLTLTDNSIVELTLGPSATHSTLARTGSGTWAFDSHQAFTFLESATPTGTYQSIITGLSSDPGTESNWTITNADFTGIFTYDAGNIDLAISQVPEPGTWVAAALAFGAVAYKQRRQLLERRRKVQGR